MLKTAKTEAMAFSNSVEHEINSSWSNIGKGFVSGIAGMFAVESVKSGLESFIEAGKEIKETAEQVDMSTESWQKWTKAVEDAGLSTDGFMRVIEALRQKRTDAFTDPKARGELTRLGFSDQDILGNMDMTTFATRALQNANQGDIQRGYLGAIIGDRGLKYATALPYYDAEQADFSEQDLKEADEATKAFRELRYKASRGGIALIENLTGNERETTRTFAWYNAFWKELFSGHWGNNFFDRVSSQANAAADRAGFLEDSFKPVKSARRATAAKPGEKAQPGTAKDPLDAKIADQAEEWRLHKEEQDQRMLDAQRPLMTIEQRRQSIYLEMTGLQSEIADRQKKIKDESFLTDAQKDELAGITGKARTLAVNALMEKYADQTQEMQMRLLKDQSDMRQRPLDFGADSMARVGLYSAANLAFNPVLSAQIQAQTQAANKQTQFLAVIAQNTTPRNNSFTDPHHP